MASVLKILRDTKKDRQHYENVAKDIVASGNYFSVFKAISKIINSRAKNIVKLKRFSFLFVFLFDVCENNQSVSFFSSVFRMILPIIKEHLDGTFYEFFVKLVFDREKALLNRYSQN